MATILLLNGPNLNLLGQREPDIYGHTTLSEIENNIRSLVEAAGHAFRCFQSNSEGEMVDWLQQNRDCDFLILNAGAFTHTSVALRDAVISTDIPLIEIHISNIYRRESFRHHSYLSDIAEGLIAGLGVYGYELAAQHILKKLKSL